MDQTHPQQQSQDQPGQEQQDPTKRGPSDFGKRGQAAVHPSDPQGPGRPATDEPGGQKGQVDGRSDTTRAESPSGDMPSERNEVDSGTRNGSD
jgi:hypothetical protein